MNPTLESRLDALRDALDNLSRMVDENLRAVLLRLTLDENMREHSPLVCIDEVARDARERCLLLVAREHPLAADLKYAMAALRVGHDYERIQELTLALNKRVDRLRGTPLQELVREMVGLAKKYPSSVVFVPNYDLQLGRILTRGVDVWLNTPQRPLEACGTSGMKAAMNGVLNCSILDGWWPEACDHGVNGWAIGERLLDDDGDDARDAAALYALIEDEIVPTFYDNRARWRRMMRESIAVGVQQFSSDRMVADYYTRLYRRAPAVALRRAAGNR